MPSATPFSGLAFVSVHVSDLARARPFYEKVLGLKVHKSFGDDEVMYDFFGTLLDVHVDPKGECGRLPGGPTGFYLRVPSIAKALEDLRRAGADITYHDERHVGIQDPDGNEFVLLPAE